MDSDVTVRPFEHQEWPLLRDLRLMALADSPDAFARTWAEERRFDDAEWKRRLAEAAAVRWQLSLLAERAGAPAGLAHGRLEDDGSDIAHLYSMWVAPEARRAGVGRALVRAVVAWARGAGARRLLLGVTEGNGPAARLYASAGFVRTGERRALREGSDLLVETMALDL